jgi:Plasmid pRiA4b ORF-3-like protein
VAFGWEDAHLHAFEVGGRRYSRPDFELWDEAADEGKARLQDLASRPGARLRYTYDFGDSWEHDRYRPRLDSGAAIRTWHSPSRAACGWPLSRRCM